jgi:hypothetical protein
VNRPASALFFFALVACVFGAAQSRAETEACLAPSLSGLASVQRDVKAFLDEINPVIEAQVKGVLAAKRSTVGDAEARRLEAFAQSGDCSALFIYRNERIRESRASPASAAHFTSLLPEAIRQREARRDLSSALFAACAFRLFEGQVDHSWSALEPDRVLAELRILSGLRDWLDRGGAASVKTAEVDRARFAVERIAGLKRAIELDCHRCVEPVRSVMDSRQRTTLDTLAKASETLISAEKSPRARRVIDHDAEKRRSIWQSRLAHGFIEASLADGDGTDSSLRIRPLAELIRVAQKESLSKLPRLAQDYASLSLEAQVGLSGRDAADALYDYSVKQRAWQEAKKTILDSLEGSSQPGRLAAALAALQKRFPSDQRLDLPGADDEARTGLGFRFSPRRIADSKAEFLAKGRASESGFSRTRYSPS